MRWNGSQAIAWAGSCERLGFPAVEAGTNPQQTPPKLPPPLHTLTKPNVMPVGTRLPALRHWLIHHWFVLANSLFWLIAGWEAFATAIVLQSQVYQLPAFVLLRVVPGWMFCQWLHQALQRRPAWRALLGWRRAALVIALLSGFALAITLLLRAGRLGLGMPDPAMTYAKLWIYVLGLELRLMVWAGFYLLIAESRERLQVQARHAATELAMSRAQLSLLSASFQPHFLMNAMNTLIACRHDPDAVESAGEGLAGYLRYTLDRSDAEWEPLATQLEALNNYLSVEELRFGDRLETRITSDPHLLYHSVPRFMLQPLVENAIKHGCSNSAGVLQLHVSLERAGDQLQLQVSNTGVLASTNSRSQSGVGYGLNGLDQRLHWHYGDQSSFSINQQGSWVIAKLLLPLR